MEPGTGAPVELDDRRLADVDPAAVSALLDAREEALRDQGQLKWLALANRRAGRLDRAIAYLRQIDREALSHAERRVAAAIRNDWRLARRARFGFHFMSDKPWTRRVADAVRNLARHGRIHVTGSSAARMPSAIREISTKVRIERGRDARAVRRLLDEHESEFVERGQSRFLAFNYYHAGSLAKAAHYAEQLDPAELTDQERVFAANIAFEYRALQRLRSGRPPVAMPSTAVAPAATAGPTKSLYIAASSRPYIVSGYTSRSEALVTALQGCADFAVVPVTRPGFPADRRDAREAAEDGAGHAFETLPADALFQGDLEEYLSGALDTLEPRARDLGITLVHGVSNHRNGVIGLALARRLGLPFVYEVRGLWEETTDAKLAGWRDTERFEYERRSEAFLAREADGVLVINAPVRDELGLEAGGNVHILPNCVPEQSIVERSERNEGKGLTIGYIGSVLEYEGLDDLVHAIAMVQQHGLDVRLDIYGRGGDRQRLSELAADLGARGVTCHGEVEPERIANLYAGFDLCVFPRKPHRVCQLVTPLKPFEAMANDVNVIVSDVAPMAFLAEEDAALSFAAGDARALADQIERFAAMTPRQRSAMRTKAREMLKRSFVWERQCGTIAETYRQAADAHAARNAAS